MYDFKVILNIFCAFILQKRPFTVFQQKKTKQGSVSRRHLNHLKLCVASPRVRIVAWSPWRQAQRKWGEQLLQVEAKERERRKRNKSEELQRKNSRWSSEDEVLKGKSFSRALKVKSCKAPAAPSGSQQWWKSKTDHLVGRRRPLELTLHLIV